MADTDPIELKFVLNSPEVLEEFKKMVTASKDLDASVDGTKQKFSQFIVEQLKANQHLDENAQLTAKQTAALQRHSEALMDLKQKMESTFDPTQAAVYDYQINQIESSIQKIIEASNKNVQLMDPAEIEAANQKIKEAQVILDRISDTSITPNFASPEELDALSNEINKTDDAFQQLGTVIDFVQAKMSGMDQGSEEFKQLEADINAANNMLGRTPQLYDATGNSINQMNDALKTFQEQLSSETSPEAIKTLNTNIETLEKGIQAVKNSGKTGFDEFGNKLEDQKEKTVSLQTELEKLVNDMARLRLENKENSQEYEILKNKAVETRSAIALTNNEISTGVKNTASLQGLINITQNIAAGYGLVTGAVGLFNSNQEESQRIIQKVTSVIAVLQSLQQIQVALNTKDAATTAVLTTSKNFLTAASLRLAAALGITQIAAAALMATLTLGLTLVIAAVIYAFNRLADKQKEQQELNKKVAESLAAPIMSYRKLQQAWNELGNDLDAKKKFITENASEFNKLGVTVNDVQDAENIFVKNTAAMIEALRLRAKAAAAMELATEQYKIALEAQMEYGSDMDTMKNGSVWEKFTTGLKANIFTTNQFTNTINKQNEANTKANKLFNESIDLTNKSQQVKKKAGITPESSGKFEYNEATKIEEHKLRVAKERGLKTDKMEMEYLNKKLRYAQTDKNEYEKVLQEIELFQARSLNKQDDAAKKASDKRQREAEAAAKKAQRLAEQAAEARVKVLEKISAAEENLKNKETEGDEIAAIKKKYDALRNEAKKVGLGSFDIMRIDTAETKETDIKKYEIETKALLKSLSDQKDLYAAYEAMKTQIGETEAAKRFNISLNEFGTYGDLLKSEIKKLSDIQQRSFEENERLKALQNQKSENDTEVKNKDNSDYAKAYQDALTHQEKLQMINKTYADKALQLQKISDANLRTAKLGENEKQRQDAISAANREAYEKSSVYQRMSQNLIGITKQELSVRIASLEEYLEKVRGNITKEEEAFIKSEIEKAKSIQSNSNIGVYENSLLIEKQRLLADIAAKKKDGIVNPKDAEELDAINQKLKITLALKAQTFASDARALAGGFHDMASAIGDSNEGLADTLDTMGDVLNIASDAAGAFASFASGDIIGGITGVMKTIAGIFSMGKKARESEKKAQEEIKKRQEEQIQAQLDYNATLRQRIADEVKLNDLYKSRVDNIREQIEANKKNAAQIIKDQQDIFKRLLNAQTVAGVHSEKYGGFLGIGRKTRAVEELKTVAELLGIGSYTSGPFGMQIFKPGEIELTDDLFEKLEKLNAQQPLTGDAKLAYEQLKKLRDEYGSIAEANRQLEIELKNAITGTTAQSLADSIREGLKSGKKSFADFADDIEGFLRDAILAGISAKMIEPKIQELQDALAEMMGDGILSADERAQFQEMYMAIVNSSQEYMDIINEAGINLITGSANANSLSGALKAASQESIDLLSGQTMGMRLAQLETNVVLKSGFAQQLQQTSQMLETQMNIEQNTKRTADNTEKLFDVNDNVVRVVDGQDKYYKALQAAGIIN